MLSKPKRALAAIIAAAALSAALGLSAAPAGARVAAKNDKFCATLTRAITAQLEILQAFVESPTGGPDLGSRVGQIQKINRQLKAAAPRKLRATISTFVAAGEALLAAVRAQDPDPGTSMRTPDALAASHRLSDYAIKVCKVSVTGG